MKPLLWFQKKRLFHMCHGRISLVFQNSSFVPDLFQNSREQLCCSSFLGVAISLLVFVQGKSKRTPINPFLWWVRFLQEPPVVPIRCLSRSRLPVAPSPVFRSRLPRLGRPAFSAVRGLQGQQQLALGTGPHGAGPKRRDGHGRVRLQRRRAPRRGETVKP